MGATVNMDGSALFECAGILFIAQTMGVSMGFDQQVLIVMTSLLASIAAAGVPSCRVNRNFYCFGGRQFDRPTGGVDCGHDARDRSSARHVPHSGQCVQRFLRGGDYCALGGGERRGHGRGPGVSELDRGHKLFCGVKHIIPFCIWYTDSGLAAWAARNRRSTAAAVVTVAAGSEP